MREFTIDSSLEDLEKEFSLLCDINKNPKAMDNYFFTIEFEKSKIADLIFRKRFGSNPYPKLF